MVTDIKCERCGHINRAEPESQCEKCDEYLYQFYLRQKNRNRNTKIAIASVIVAIIVIGFLFKLTTLPKDKAPLPDPVKEDLINYLKQIRVQREKVQNSSAAKEYDRYVTGELNEDDKGLILSKMGLQEMPNYDNDRWEEYWKKIEVRSQQIIKSKNLKERYKIEMNYRETEAHLYSQITPVTNEVESIHKCLIKSKELEVKAYENFVSGMDLGYISNVREKDDGITWTYPVHNAQYSDTYKQCKESSRNEENSYFRMLEQLIIKYNVLTDYENAWPYRGYMKKRTLQQSTAKK